MPSDPCESHVSQLGSVANPPCCLVFTAWTLMVGFPGGGCLKEHSDKVKWLVYCIVALVGGLLASRVARFARFGFR